MSALTPVGNTYSSYVKYYPFPPQECLLFAQYFAINVKNYLEKPLHQPQTFPERSTYSQGTWTPPQLCAKECWFIDGLFLILQALHHLCFDHSENGVKVEKLWKVDRRGGPGIYMFDCISGRNWTEIWDQFTHLWKVKKKPSSLFLRSYYSPIFNLTLTKFPWLWGDQE